MAIIVHTNASRILPKLYQGGFPERTGRWLHACGVDVLVLCAEEHQPPASDYPGVEIIRCPFGDVDGALDSATTQMVFRTADRVARRHRSGRRVLVTCHAGINRSGLVTALAITMITGCSGIEAVRIVRKHRQGGALTNAHFAWLLQNGVRAAVETRA